MMSCQQIIRRRDRYERQYRQLWQRLADMGPVKRGSIYKTYSGCGSPGCRCHSDPQARHGPYWFWTSKSDGKSHCRQLRGTMLTLYRRYASNYKKLKQTLEQLETLSDRILECQLKLAELDAQGGRSRRRQK